MPKNIVIFSDGTGQAGGFRFDENRSNIYKLYRAARCGPDSSVDPREQIAFYDPGLGSQADGGHLVGRLARWIHNIVAQATGFGITRNIIDCYAALIQLWRPGDRIFLFGFSRGAYTARCVAGVIARCGIPTHPDKEPGKPLRIDPGSAQKLAAYAVKHVYQFTYPRRTEEATPYQKFLLSTREKLAERFRNDYGSGNSGNANVYPHFIGVFDTVAALISPATTGLFVIVFLLFAAALGVIGQVLALFGGVLQILSFSHVFWGTIVFAALVAFAVYVFTHLKWDFSLPGYGFMDSLRTIHFNGLWMTFYDCELNPNVGYARHALSIDENRANFKRVGWFSNKETSRDADGIQWFEQVWFAGNHSDIGGSYIENESRLSDTSLDWMLSWASSIPGGLKYDRRVLNLTACPDGAQHDEVKRGLGLITAYLGWTWTEAKRKLPGDDAIMHRSVYERFDLDAVQVYDELVPYRPTTLATHNDFAAYYKAGAPFPAQSLKSATALADEPRPSAGS